MLTSLVAQTEDWRVYGISPDFAYSSTWSFVIASFPGSPRTRTKMESDEKLGGAWKQGYINAVIVQEKIYVIKPSGYT